MAVSCLERLAGRPQTPMVQHGHQQQQEDAGARRIQQRWAAHVPAARDLSSPGRSAAQQDRCDLEKESSRRATSRATQRKIPGLAVKWPAWRAPALCLIWPHGYQPHQAPKNLSSTPAFFFSFSFSSFSRESNRKRTRALARHGAHPPSAKSVGG